MANDAYTTVTASRCQLLNGTFKTVELITGAIVQSDSHQFVVAIATRDTLRHLYLPWLSLVP